MRIGIDLGGTKIEGIVLRGESEVIASRRVATPAGDYAATIAAIAALVRALEAAAGGARLPVGVGHPGSLSPASGRLRNSNSVCLNGRPFRQDLEAALGREVRLANDADCLALSEACDGAAAGARATIFAAILGTGVGGGIVVDGKLVQGANGIAGEWGHNPLPWPRADWNEIPGPLCWHGLHGCLETWLSGPALAADHARVSARQSSAQEIVESAWRGEAAAAATLERYCDRLARALAQVINLLDPEVIVLGGGVSRLEAIYREVPRRWGPWIFSDAVNTRLVPARHGAASGVRGAARLWPLADGKEQ